MKIEIFRLLFQSKNREVWAKKKLSLSDNFGMLISGLDTYFLEVSAHSLPKVATKIFFRGKKYKNLVFLGYFSDTKTEGYNLKDWSVCHRFDIIIPCSVTCFLEIGARVSLKVITKVFFRDKKPVKIEIFRLLFQGKNGGG